MSFHCPSLKRWIRSIIRHEDHPAETVGYLVDDLTWPAVERIFDALRLVITPVLEMVPIGSALISDEGYCTGTLPLARFKTNDTSQRKSRR